MNIILLLIVVFSTHCVNISASNNIDSSEPDFAKHTPNIFHKVAKEASCFGAGVAFGSASLAAKLGWGICSIAPWSSSLKNEFLFFSNLCSYAAKQFFTQMFKECPPSTFEGVPVSQSSWYLNQSLLSQIPAFSTEEKQLLSFLENRWLAKATGFFPSMVDWICPCYGVDIQVHPETSSCCYARNPGNKIYLTYKNRIESWKDLLPHPKSFPLILTRPFNLQKYLPSLLDVPLSEEISTTIERLKKHIGDSQVIVDLTNVLPEDIQDRGEWLRIWEQYQGPFSQACKEHGVNMSRILCIQRVYQEHIGGIRLLPLALQSTKEVDRNYQFLLEWISGFGLSVNLVELDRWPFSSNVARPIVPPVSIHPISKEEFISYLESFDQKWNSAHPQKALMVRGTVQLLKGLFDALSKDKWEEILSCPTRSSIAQLSFSKIKEQLNLLVHEKKDALFFNTASKIEQIHADLSSLLEIFAPFTKEDFPNIYREALTSIPQNLKPLTSCGVHSTGMTSLTGILKSVEQSLHALPRILYGENTYFESINAVKRIANAASIQEASEEDWKHVDLILAQFNPVLKRIDVQTTEYKVERIAQILHKSIQIRQGKPLTLALDCTFDFIDSNRVGELLKEFQEEIKSGILNVICYRSGLKFDLFGMDNYSGAPFYMIHNEDSKWASFDSLLTDPVLQSDRLSMNWFCLAYRSTVQELELYRKQIFNNTRALLSKVPSRILNVESNYRIVPVEPGADPGFIDIKVSGPLHKIKSAALVGGCLYTKCMEGGHPVFYRPSVGFYHPNFTMIFSKDNSTIRLTLGLDPSQVDLLAECFEMIDALNAPPKSLSVNNSYSLASPSLSPRFAF
ncbi:MAG TPA: hypothetical protein VLG49_07850 [Rhabdochlamydiaceae bacterium]|nr:hypothetical protein [Rhabdochlamydiaceae bacterium]